jgi:hypothetical protein
MLRGVRVKVSFSAILAVVTVYVACALPPMAFAEELTLKTVSIDLDGDGEIDIIQNRYFLGEELKIMDIASISRQSREISYFVSGNLLLVEKYEGDNAKPYKLQIFDEEGTGRFKAILNYDELKGKYISASDECVQEANRKLKQIETQ